MNGPLDTYLGWDNPAHRAGCKRPAWDIAIRTEVDRSRYQPRGEDRIRHGCEQEGCTHGNDFEETLVRIVCHSCGAARLISGEKTADTGETTTSTKALGYGLPPRRYSGLLLWPAEPWLNYGRGAYGATEPHDFVVTGPQTKTVTEDTIVGQITLSSGARGGLVWTALAVPDSEGQFGYGLRLRFVHANDSRGRGGSPLRSVGGAARWIAARLAEQQAQGGAA